jgi:hypothetical protein
LGKLKIKLVQILFLISIISITTAFTFGSGCIRNFEEASNYNIKNMDISADRIGTAFVDLNVITYIEKNSGDAAKNTSLLLKAYSMESGLLIAQNEVKLGTMKKGDTSAISQNLSLPKTGGYNLRSVLFEENTQKSDGEIKIYNLDALPADAQDIGLEIPEMDFRVKQVEGGKVFVESDIYLTNEGKEISRDFRMLIKVREMDAGLLADKVWTQTGKIRPEATVIKSVNLTMPDQYNYVVEVLIWNNDMIVKSGEDYIQLSPKTEIRDKNTITETRKIQTSDFESSAVVEELPKSGSEKGESAAPGFGLLLSVILLCSAVILRRRFR